MKRAPLTHEAVFDNSAYAEAYASHHQKMAFGFGNKLTERLQSRGFRKGRILDAGCGFGGTNLVLARNFADSEVIGMDLSAPLLQMARQAAENAGLEERLRFEKGDVQNMQFEDRSFDVVININMLHLVDDPVRMLGEIERVLARDGYFFISDLRRSWLGIIEKEIQSGMSAVEAQRLIERSKLREGKFSTGLLWWQYEAARG